MRHTRFTLFIYYPHMFFKFYSQDDRHATREPPALLSCRRILRSAAWIFCRLPCYINGGMEKLALHQPESPRHSRKKQGN
jgi:hypothetical protein